MKKSDYMKMVRELNSYLDYLDTKNELKKWDKMTRAFWAGRLRMFLHMKHFYDLSPIDNSEIKILTDFYRYFNEVFG